MSARWRYFLSCSVILIACRETAGSSVLLRSSSKNTPELRAVQTYAGESAVLISPVEGAAPVTVVLLLDQLNSAQFSAIEKDLVTLYSSLRRHPLTVALIRDGSLGIAGPFVSRLRLKAALDDAAQNIPATAALDATHGASSLDTLCMSARQLGAKWSNTLVVGEFPTVDPQNVEFASAMLVRAFTSQQVQLSWFAPSGGGDAWLPALRATGGNLIGTQLSDFATSLDEAPPFLFQVNWSPTPPSTGFVISRATLLDQQGRFVLETPDLAWSSSGALPSVEQYLAIQSKLAEAARLLEQGPGDADKDSKIHKILQEALGANPHDPTALEISATFSEQRHDYQAAAGFRTALAEVRPRDPGAYAALGHVLRLNGEWDKSAEALKRAISMGVLSQLVAEDFAHLYLGKKNDQAALPFLDEALRADPHRQDLWFLQGETAERAGNSSLAIHSYQEGLALAGVHISETASLLRLLLVAKRKVDAQELALRTVSAFPADGAVRIQFASALDDLEQFPEALAAWKRVLEVRPDYEQAHYRIARLLLDSGDAPSALASASAGLKAAPKSASLYVVKAEALSVQNHVYDARRVLQQGAEIAPNPALLSRLAEAEDLSGGGTRTYARLAESLAGSPAERERALERGLRVSLREGDLQEARSFAALLASAGHPEFNALVGTEGHDESGVMVPGGLDALAFAAHAGEQIPREHFFAEYCRAILPHLLPPNQSSKAYIEEIHAHFQRIAAIEAFGKRDGDRVIITMTLKGKEERRRAEKLLELLGIKLHSSKGEVALNRGEKKEQARKQETVSALALDEVGMQDAFQSGKPFTFEIVDERVPLYPGERVWREAFYPQGSERGGLATAVLRAPKIAQLYLAISELDPKSAAALLSTVQLQTLDERHAALLDNFGTAFAVEGTRAAVPGGRPAEPIWTSLVGVSPDHAGAFFRALLDRENGKLLAFFSTLSQLDRAHQLFFTANAERVSRFYKLFAAREEFQHGNLRGDATFTEVLRSAPLDQDNHLKFSGSAEVWTVAKGRSSDQAQMAKLMKKVSKAAAPDVEDEVLLRLAQTRYKDKAERHTELDNFLAVSRIDAHRREPLDEESALLLAQHFADFSDDYSYFMDLTGLEADGFREFFAAVEHLSLSSPMDANLRLGQLHSLIEWICLLSQHRVIDDENAAKLFELVCRRFSTAENGAGYVNAALDSSLAILSHCPGADSSASADEQIRHCFLGASGLTNSPRAAEFQRVLELQGAPKLDSVFAIHQGARKLLSKGAGDPAAIEKSAAALPSVELPKSIKELGEEKNIILRYDPAGVRKIAQELRLKASKRKLNPKDLEKVGDELIGSLEPQVTAALAGPVYAYFLRPSDLVVREDPLLLRKHRYFNFGPAAGNHPAITESLFHRESAGAGSYFTGGFAQFPLAAGEAASVGWKTAGPEGEAMIAAEIAAIRSAIWDQLQESDLHLVRLRTEIAREWILESATRSEEFRSLSDETMGLLSLARRAELLNSIEARNWKAVWNAITVPDLFTLGGRFVERHRETAWTSPVVSALRSLSASSDGSRLNALGAIPYRSYGCAHPHLLTNAPYEEYERHTMPADVAERSAEFKIFLALQADSLGVEPPALANVAESLAAKAFRGVHVVDYRDWRGLFAAYSTVSTNDLARALAP